MDGSSRVLAVIVLACGLAAGCTHPKPSPENVVATPQGTLTKAGHQALATRYEQAAQYAESKVEEQQKLRDHWQEHRDLYGKQSGDMQEHYDALIHHYRQIAQANRKLAQMHRELVASPP